jgi:hypothetical protein
MRLRTLLNGHCCFVCLTKSVYLGRYDYRMEKHSCRRNQKVIQIECWLYSTFYVIIFFEVFLMTNTNIAWSNVLCTLCLVSFYLNTEVDRAPETSDILLTRQRATSRDNIAIQYYTAFTNGSPHYAFLTYLATWNIVIIMKQIIIFNVTVLLEVQRLLLLFAEMLVYSENYSLISLSFVLLLVVFPNFEIPCIQHGIYIFLSYH